MATPSNTVRWHLVSDRVEVASDLVLPAAFDQRGAEQRERALAERAQPDEGGRGEDAPQSEAAMEKKAEAI